MGFLPTGTITAGQIFSNASGGVTSAGNLTSLVGCNYYDANYTQRTVPAPSIGAPMQLSTFRGMTFTNGLNYPNGYPGTLPNQDTGFVQITYGGQNYGNLRAQITDITYSSFLRRLNSISCKYSGEWSEAYNGSTKDAYTQYYVNLKNATKEFIVDTRAYPDTANVAVSYNFNTNSLSIGTITTAIDANFIPTSIRFFIFVYSVPNIWLATGVQALLDRTYNISGIDPVILTPA